MNIKPIRTKSNYRAALKDIESLMAAKANTSEGDRLDVLTTLVEAYEGAHFPMDLPDAVEAIRSPSTVGSRRLNQVMIESNDPVRQGKK